MSEKGLYGLKKGSFAEGIAAFNTRGSCVVTIRLNKRMKEILLEMINESRSNLAIKFKEESTNREDIYLSTLKWLENKLTGDKTIKIRFTKQIGKELLSWINEHKYHHLSGEKDFDNAMQWITNHVSRKWSHVELYGSE